LQFGHIPAIQGEYVNFNAWIGVWAVARHEINRARRVDAIGGLSPAAPPRIVDSIRRKNVHDQAKRSEASGLLVERRFDLPPI
jgi:hypothetical protein